MSFVSEPGSHHREFRLSDHGSRSDGGVDVGDPFAAGSRTAAVANKQIGNHITSLAISSVRESSEKSKEWVLLSQNRCLYKLVATTQALLRTYASCQVVPQPWEWCWKNKCLIFRAPDMAEIITSADG